ncbi:hypothetical protein [Candidatus Erwinia haradaeae]|nr:hypothetical protein [Candidatus Erwinia haradaeae]
MVRPILSASRVVIENLKIRQRVQYGVNREWLLTHLDHFVVFSVQD